MGLVKLNSLNSLLQKLKNTLNLLFRRDRQNSKLKVEINSHNSNILDLTNNKIVRLRSTVQLELIDNIKVARKTFHNTAVGKTSFKNEKRAYDLFKNYPWFPNTLEIGDNFITYEYIPNEYRLDQQKEKLKKHDKENILHQILLIIIELFKNNIAHRDIHAKNIFYKNNRVVLIDYEVIGDLDPDTDFFESYDISGKNLKSPLNSGNMHLFNMSQFALINFLQLKHVKSIDDVKNLINEMIKDSLFKMSANFFTRKGNMDGRHNVLQNKIYSTYDLVHTKIEMSIAQRDLNKRLHSFQIDKESIKNKSILDVGSHTGGLVFELSKYNPSYALGIEYDFDKVQLSNLIHTINIKNSPIEFKTVDVESDYFINEYENKFDLVFCLALLGHIKNKRVFMSKLYSLCNNTLYLEGNSNTSSDDIKILLIESGFKNIIYLGTSNDENNTNNNNRPLFVATKF